MSNQTVTETVTAYLTACMIGSEYRYRITTYDESEYGAILVATMDVDLEMMVPEGFDPVNGHIDSLKAEKQKVAAKAQVKMNNLEEQIQSLLAIEHKES